MKLDPRANDRVRSSWRLRSIPSPFREQHDSTYDTCANRVLGSVNMRFWVIVGNSETETLPKLVAKNPELNWI
jgi:hypothetical protein